jgi:hypothetical protein
MQRITPRLAIVHRPSSRGTCPEERRISPLELNSTLNGALGQGNWLLINASSKGRREIDYTQLSNSVSEWQPYTTIPGLVDDLPGLGQTLRLLHTLLFHEFWGCETGAAIFCNTSLTRSGFLAAAYLAHCEKCGMDAALGKVSSALYQGDPGALQATFTPAWRYLARGMTTLLTSPPPQATVGSFYKVPPSKKKR